MNNQKQACQQLHNIGDGHVAMRRSMHEITLRRAVVTDAGLICAHRYHAAGDAEHDRLAYQRWIEKSIPLGNYVGVMADVDQVTVGGGGLVALNWGPTKDDPCETRMRIVNMFVDADVRRSGIGRAILDQLLAVGRDMGINTFTLATSAEGASLYASVGFRKYQAEMILKRSTG